MFDVVSAVEQYSEFVPWCQRSTILRRESPESLEAELEVGFQAFVERWDALRPVEQAVRRSPAERQQGTPLPPPRPPHSCTHSFISCL